MISAHHDHVRREIPQRGHDRVELFDRLDLAWPVTVLSGRVCVLVVQEEVVVGIPVLAQQVKTLLIEHRPQITPDKRVFSLRTGHVFKMRRVRSLLRGLSSGLHGRYPSPRC